METQEIKGDWSITKGRLKQAWENLTDDDLRYEDGKQEELWGESRNELVQLGQLWNRPSKWSAMSGAP